MFLCRLRTVALAAGFGLVLASCSSVHPPMQRMPQMTFSNLPAYNLAVGKVDVVSEFQSSGKAPHIEYDIPVAPQDALLRWVQDRLHPVGGTARLRVTIRDASAVEEVLPTDKSLGGMFKKEQASKVTMHLKATLQIIDERCYPIAEVNGEAERDRTTLEGQKLNERDKMLYDMVEDLMLGFNSQVDPNIGQVFTPWLSRR